MINEQERDAQQLRQHRLALRFGRVGGQHNLDSWLLYPVRLVGIGTSWHAAQHGAWLLAEAGVDARSTPPTSRRTGAGSQTARP